MEKKKIGILIPDISQGNGTERAVINLANILIINYNVTIFSGTLKEKIKFDMNKNIKVVNLELPDSRTTRITRLYYYLRLIQEIKKIKEVEFLLGTTHLYNIFLCLFSKIKILACEHMGNAALKGTVRKIREVVYCKSYKVVVLTKDDYYYYNKVLKNKAVIIPNSLSFNVEEKNSLENKQIIAVGRLTEQKGFDLLLENINLIKNEMNGWKVKIYGKGHLKQKLQKQILEYELQHIVEIKEPIKNIKKEYLKSSIYLLSSRWEGLPMVLIEALACNLPIISYNCPTGPSELIEEEKNGFLIKPFDKKEFSKKLLLLIKNKELRKQFGEYSGKKSEEYTPEIIREKWLEILGDENNTHN